MRGLWRGGGGGGEGHVFFIVGRTSWFQTSFRLIKLKNSLFHSYDWGDSLPFIAASAVCKVN